MGAVGTCRLLVGVISISAAVGTSGCFGDPNPDGAAGTVERFVKAIDEHDGEEVCSLFSDDVRARYDDAAQEANYPGLDCGKLVGAYIGYVEDSGIPVWKHVRLEGEPQVTVDGGRARVSFYVTHEISDYDADEEAEFVAPVRQADVVELVEEGFGRWKLATTGQTLARAGPGTFFRTVDPVGADDADAAAAEAFARDYVLILSGAPIEPCAVTPPPPGAEAGCENAHSVALDYSLAPEGPIWQAAEVDDMSVDLDGDQAVVNLGLTETYLSAEDNVYELSTRPFDDELVLRRGDDGWELDEPSQLYYHATGRPPPSSTTRAPGESASLLDRGRPCEPSVEHALPCATGPVLTRGPRSGLAFWSVTAADRGSKLRVRRLNDVKPRGHSRALVGFDPPGESGPYGPNDLTAVQDRRRGNGLVAWTTSNGDTVSFHAMPIDARGRRAGPTRQFAPPISYLYPALTLSDDPHSGQFLASWRDSSGEGAPDFAVAARLDSAGRSVGTQIALPETHTAGPVVSPAPGGGWLVGEATPGLPDNPTVPSSSTMSVTKVNVKGQVNDGFRLAIPKQLSPPALSLAPDGESALIAWVQGDDDADRARLFARRLGPDGQAVGRRLGLSGELDTQFSTASSTQVRLVPIRDGYVVAWTLRPLRQRPEEFAYRRLDAMGIPAGPQRGWALDLRSGDRAGVAPAPSGIVVDFDPERQQISLSPATR